MRKIIFAVLTLIVICAVSSCNSKSDKLKQEQLADSLRQDSVEAVASENRTDSIKHAEDSLELNEKKIAFLKSIYKNIIYTENEEMSTQYAGKMEEHLSPKVKKAMSEYDDGIEDEYSISSPQWFLLGDPGDYERLDIQYTPLPGYWFEVNINDNTILKVRVESSEDDDEFFIITGIDNPSAEFKVE